MNIDYLSGLELSIFSVDFIHFSQHLCKVGTIDIHILQMKNCLENLAWTDIPGKQEKNVGYLYVSHHHGMLTLDFVHS